MPPTAARWTRWPRILAEELAPLDEPLAVLLRAGAPVPAPVAARAAARAILDLPADDPLVLPPWLVPHQRPAVRRLVAILRRHGGGVLADAVGLGKSYVALAVAVALGAPFALIVPAVLAGQWRALLGQLHLDGPIVTHERLSAGSGEHLPALARGALLLVDEAHRFRNPDTRRYRALARLAVGRQLLLVTATPVHNRVGDLLHLLRLFLRDDALTALGVTSLRLAARAGTDEASLRMTVARLVVARSRHRAAERGTGPLLRFPDRTATTDVRIGAAPPEVVTALTAAIRHLPSETRAAALVRLLLLSRLASSLPALRATAARLAAFGAATRDAAREGRALAARDFRRWFPAGEAGDVQLALTPLLVDIGPRSPEVADPDAMERIVAATAGVPDPKVVALDALLGARRVKTIVFTGAQATARHLARVLARHHRVAVVTGSGGAWGSERVHRDEVLRAFAPRALHGAAPPAALLTDVLIATDLMSEGLNLQDAGRVVHYDLPWSPARLAQRVGRIDRAGSPHPRIETVTFLPPTPLARAIAIETRLARKLVAQRHAGAAQTEPARGEPGGGGLDWCDRLQAIAEGAAPAGAAAVHATAVVLAVRLGGPAGPVEALVADAAGCRADPAAATGLLAAARELAPSFADDAPAVRVAVARAAALIRARLATLAAARWRAADRDGAARRLIPWVLTAARRAAREGDAHRLHRLDALVARLARGMTAGEELALGELLESRRPLRVDDLLRWHERLPPLEEPARGPAVELVAAVVVGNGASGYLSACPRASCSSTSTAP